MSEWKQAAASRRDFRAGCGVESTTAKPVPAKKDKARWCRGKVGQEHDPQFARALPTFGVLKPLSVYRCSKCGRKSYREG